MRLLLCLALLFVLATTAYCGYGRRHRGGNPWLQVREKLENPEDVGISTETDEDDDFDEDDEDDDDDHDDDEDDDDDDQPTKKPMQGHQCMTKFRLCMKKVFSRFDCDGKVKCFEEKSKCYQAYKAKMPQKQPPSKEKMECKNTFNTCIGNARPNSCVAKLKCYMAKGDCYMKFKRYGRRHHHHHRRRHHHHRHRRPHPSPKMMKCKKEWMWCVRKANNCSEMLTCMWSKLKCMKHAMPTKPPKEMQPDDDSDDDEDDDDDDMPSWKRKWDPKVKAKCKKEFYMCINKSTTCQEKMKCFWGMKKCFMAHRRGRPTPCPKMMKCKMEWKNCTEEARNCTEKLTCMWRKHECMKRIMPTEPPTGNGNMPEWRRRRWNPEIKEKCEKGFKKCITESSTCPKKIKCFWEMKKCFMMHRHIPRAHPMRQKVERIFKWIPYHIHRIIKNSAQKIKPWFKSQRGKNRMQQIKMRINQARNQMFQFKQKFQEYGKKWKQGFKSKKDQMKKRWNNRWRNPWGNRDNP